MRNKMSARKREIIQLIHYDIFMLLFETMSDDQAYAICGT